MNRQIASMIINRVVPEDAHLPPHERGGAYAYEVVGWHYLDKVALEWIAEHPETMVMNDNQTKAAEFFYPDSFDYDRGWGGYDRLFSPSIPSRIGQQLIDAISKGLNDLDPDRLKAAIRMLSNSHVKFLSQAGKGEDVVCFPTEQAAEGVVLLQNVLSNLEESP